MPRKTATCGRATSAAAAGFNEAAARCRGKLDLAERTRDLLRASMRPRPDAAEN